MWPCSGSYPGARELNRINECNRRTLRDVDEGNVDNEDETNKQVP